MEWNETGSNSADLYVRYNVWKMCELMSYEGADLMFCTCHKGGTSTWHRQHSATSNVHICSLASHTLPLHCLILEAIDAGKQKGPRFWVLPAQLACQMLMCLYLCWCLSHICTENKSSLATCQRRSVTSDVVYVNMSSWFVTYFLYSIASRMISDHQKLLACWVHSGIYF